MPDFRVDSQGECQDLRPSKELLMIALEMAEEDMQTAQTICNSEDISLSTDAKTISVALLMGAATIATAIVAEKCS